jgi:hypothetical protein
VVAVFVAGLTATARAQDISARFLEQLVKRLQQVRRPRSAQRACVMDNVHKAQTGMYCRSFS